MKRNETENYRNREERIRYDAQYDRAEEPIRRRPASDGVQRNAQPRRSAGQTTAQRTQSSRTGAGTRSASANRRPASQQQRPQTTRTRSTAPQKKKKGFRPGILIAIVLVLIAAVAAFLIFQPKKQEPEVVKPDLPAPQIASSVTVGTTGDILIHSPIYEAAALGDGVYDFSRDFALVAPYYQKPDIMVGNLEVTCPGADYGYSSYPLFSCPDNIVTTLANAGMDICLTANNHANDSGKGGMLRTLDVITENGMEYLGTRKSTDEHFILTKNVNGIKLGMVCYSYDTREYPEEQKSLNGNPLVDGADELVNSFCYNDLETLYASIQNDLNQMKMLGVEANIFFMHWGDEYQDEENAIQDEISNRMCEMGVDVIVGGHPHVIEPYKTLTSSNGHETLCLYSTGNEISNQRAHLMTEDGCRGYTEDGLIFNVTFSKFNNGKVKITELSVLPTWCDLTDDGQGRVYSIVPLDFTQSPSSWGASSEEAAVASYNRTMGRLGEQYNAQREKLRLTPDPVGL